MRSMKVMVSACLLGENCKYNGGNNENARVKAFLEGHEVITVCPELAAGLGVPRTPIEIVGGVVMDKNGNCHSCLSSQRNIDAVAGCESCENRFLSGMWIENGLGGITCNLKDQSIFYDAKKQASFDELLAKNCPDNKPILDENGNCIPCLYHHDVDSIKGCEKCPNRFIGGYSASPYTYFFKCEMKEDE